MSFRKTYDRENGLQTINNVITAWQEEPAYNKSLFFQPKSTAKEPEPQPHPTFEKKS